MTLPERTPAVTRLAAASLIAAACLLFASAVAWMTLGSRLAALPARVEVRWGADVEEGPRQQLEQRFGLSQGELKEGTASTYGYDLADVSSDNVRAVVTDPAVIDTHDLDRDTFSVSPDAKRLIVEGSGTDWLIWSLRQMALWFAALGAGALALGILPRLTPAAIRAGLRRSRALPSATARWLAGRVPDASPQAVALFRVVFGATLVAWLTLRSPSHSPEVRAWLVVCGTLFVLGVASRLTFAALVAGAFAWAPTSGASTHEASAMLMALLCLLPSRWGDAWSVDAWWRRRSGRAMPERSPAQYGYTLWVPALVLGILFAAAAAAKLRGGFGWIANGTVKYHFLTDSAKAQVDWGLRLGPHDGLAVLMSFAAVAVEAATLPAVLAARYWVRAAAGAAAALLLLGFYLLQGVLWPGWWLMLAGFLPWHLVRSGDLMRMAASRSRGLRPVHVAIVGALVTQQIVVSALHIEFAPILSTYDMYSTSYASREDYEVKTSRAFQLVAELDGRGRVACDLDSTEAGLARDAIRQRAGIEPLLERCFGGTSARSVSVEVTRTAVDWTRWRLLGETQVTLAGPLRLTPEP